MTAHRTILLTALACLVFSGCTLGFKKWPQPQEQQDAISWHAVTPQIAGKCLIVEARLSGAFENLKSVRLMVQPLTEAACPECPFHPVTTMTYAPGDPDFESVGPWMKMYLCPVVPDTDYRLQLEVQNKLDGMGSVRSDIVRVSP